MSPSIQYCFRPGVRLVDARETLELAVIACQALHGEPAVLLSTRWHFDNSTRRCTINGDDEVSHDLNLIFAGLIIREFGPESFRICRN